MARYSILLICFTFFTGAFAFETDCPGSRHQNLNQVVLSPSRQDTMIINQILFNGKVWIGLYYGVHGTEFFIDKEWKKGDITMNGRVFTGMEMKYDTYNDNLLVNYLGKRVIILNSEMVEGFTVYLKEGGVTRFTNMTGKHDMSGYYELLYDGGIKLYKKYKKRRAQFAVEARYDEFQDINSLWLVKDMQLFMITNRQNLFNLLAGNDKNLKKDLKKGSKRLDVNSADSVRSLLEVYDKNHK
jgi:hypothetical protein